MNEGIAKECPDRHIDQEKYHALHGLTFETDKKDANQRNKTDDNSSHKAPDESNHGSNPSVILGGMSIDL